MYRNNVMGNIETMSWEKYMVLLSLDWSDLIRYTIHRMNGVI